MLTVKSVLACQVEVNGWGVGVEGHGDVVDLEMCSKINTKAFYLYTPGNNAELHFFTASRLFYVKHLPQNQKILQDERW